MTQTYVEWVNENPMRSVRYLRAWEQLKDAEEELAQARNALARVEALPLDQIEVGLKFGDPSVQFIDVSGLNKRMTDTLIDHVLYLRDKLGSTLEYAEEQKAKRDQEAARELEEKRKQRKREMLEDSREEIARALVSVTTYTALLEEAAKPIAHWSEEDVSHGEYLMYMLVDLLKTHERNVYRSDWYYSFPEKATQDYNEEITFSSIDVWVSDMLDQQTLPDIKIMYDVRWWRVTASFDGASYTRKGQGLMGSLVRALLPLLNSQWGRLIGPLT